MSSQRTIRLRRPPTVVVQDTPFVPRGMAMDEIDERWRLMCEHSPGRYDGRVSHVIGVHRNGHGGASVHVMDCAYRFFAVQVESSDLGVRHLGVKAVTMHNSRVLLGRRAEHVVAYPGLWEFAPGGVVEPGHEPAAALQRELAEETGLKATGEPVAMAIVFDPVIRCWEIVYRIVAASQDVQPRTDEYSDLRWCAVEAMPSALSPISRQIVKLL